MQNAILGMKTINVTQGNFTSYSHKGINALDLAGEDTGKDVWRAKNRWKCVNVLPYSTTGFANTCLFSPCDEFGNLVEVNTPSGVKPLTIALTHDDTIRVKVGGIYYGDIFIYREGVTGKATGPHAHAEACFAFVTNKVKLTGSQYYGGATWVLPNAVPLHKALFLLKNYNIIKNGGGYSWQWVDQIEREEKPMEFKDGLQELYIGGTKINAYKQKDGQKLGFMSAVVEGKENWQALATIDKIDNDKVHYCKMDGNRFKMDVSEHTGLEQSFENDFAPKQKEFIALWYAKDGTFGYCDADNYWDTKENVNFGCSPDAVLMKDGQVVNYRAKGVESNRLSMVTQQAILMVLKDGKFVLMTTGAISLNELVNNFKDVARDMYAFDGGGSAQMIVNGQKIQYTGRKIATVLTLYKDPNEEPQEPEKPVEPEEPQEPAEQTITLTVKEADEILSNLKNIENIIKEKYN